MSSGRSVTTSDRARFVRCFVMNVGTNIYFPSDGRFARSFVACVRVRSFGSFRRSLPPAPMYHRRLRGRPTTEPRPATERSRVRSFVRSFFMTKRRTDHDHDRRIDRTERRNLPVRSVPSVVRSFRSVTFVSFVTPTDAASRGYSSKLSPPAVSPVARWLILSTDTQAFVCRLSHVTRWLPAGVAIDRDRTGPTNQTHLRTGFVAGARIRSVGRRSVLRSGRVRSLLDRTDGPDGRAVRRSGPSLSV